MAACSQREEQFTQLLAILGRDENKFQSFTRMIPPTFDFLLELIAESSRKQDANF
jgi:hypothetical protein